MYRSYQGRKVPNRHTETYRLMCFLLAKSPSLHAQHLRATPQPLGILTREYTEIFLSIKPAVEPHQRGMIDSYILSNSNPHHGSPTPSPNPQS